LAALSVWMTVFTRDNIARPFEHSSDNIASFHRFEGLETWRQNPLLRHNRARIERRGLVRGGDQWPDAGDAHDRDVAGLGASVLNPFKGAEHDHRS